MTEKKSSNPRRPNPYFGNGDRLYQSLFCKLYRRALEEGPQPGTVRQHQEAVRGLCAERMEHLTVLMESMGRIYAAAVDSGEIEDRDSAQFGWFVSNMADLRAALEYMHHTADYDLTEEAAA